MGPLNLQRRQRRASNFDCQHERDGLRLASMTTSYCVWKQVEAPQYRKSFITVSVLSFLLIITAFVTQALWKKELMRYVVPNKHLLPGLMTFVEGSGTHNRQLAAKVGRRSDEKVSRCSANVE